MTVRVIEADLTWTGARFESGIRIAIDGNGRIASVGRPEGPGAGRLRRQALLPGFVNTHSHGFQRALRGRGERFPRGVGSFWTWREAMYKLVASLDVEAARRAYLQAFSEMRDAGITTVGEFHYLHHVGDGPDYAFDRVVLEAARAVGIRLALLNVFYKTGGIGRELDGAQRRFRSEGLAGYWAQLDRLDGLRDPGLQSLGVVAHSIRAVPLADIAELHAEAARRHLPFHMHVEEQPAEVEESVAAYGRRPMAALLDALTTAGSFTAVHCTHTDPADMGRFLAAGGTVCLCPLTEGNLGDGLPALDQIPAAGRLSLGTDSNARIGFVEEMRWLEYGQRLRLGRRGILANGAGQVAARVLEAATLGGASAVGVDAGTIEAGCWADFVAIDLDAPSLAGVDAEHLLEALVFGAEESVLWGTAVGGAWRRRGSPSAPDR
ncbi:MAG TPA: formimidoylglutamate deiminase [Gemmatimonadales bacterium]|jgi:formimidoylglutamate deiminase